MKEQIKNLIIEALSKKQIPCPNQVIVEVPREKEKGDFATNIAMQLSKSLAKNPRQLAEEIVTEIQDPSIQRIEIAGPGFINFFVDKNYLIENISTVLVQKEDYGRNNLGKQERVNLEFVSANPTGILHLGHARGAAYGDSLARILSFSGYDVTKEYYINDAGNQMNNLGVSIKARYLSICGQDAELPENGYHGKEIIEIAKQIYNEYGDQKQEEETNFFKQYGLKVLLEQIKIDLNKFHVTFDTWTSEESLYQRGLVEEVKQKLIATNKTYEQEGALFLKTTDYQDEKDRVLVKSDGANTYLLPDIAYHMDKYNRGFSTLIDVLGSDHHGYIARLKAALQILGYQVDKLNVEILQMVRLLKDGQELKMSKRTGNAVTINELVEEVGVDATRYFFVAHSLDTQMDFDLDLAVKKSNDNPIYYINYAHARICAILRDQKDLDYMNCMHFTSIQSEEAYNVLAKVYEFKEVVEKAAQRREVHSITNYAYELAALFHTYYAKEKIITDQEDVTIERCAFIKAVQITLKNALNLIGVDAYEKM